MCYVVQVAAFPDWVYAKEAATEDVQSFDAGWEPILESVPGCNGMCDNFVLSTHTHTTPPSLRTLIGCPHHISR